MPRVAIVALLLRALLENGLCHSFFPPMGLATVARINTEVFP